MKTEREMTSALLSALQGALSLLGSWAASGNFSPSDEASQRFDCVTSAARQAIAEAVGSRTPMPLTSDIRNSDWIHMLYGSGTGTDEISLLGWQGDRLVCLRCGWQEAWQSKGPQHERHKGLMDRYMLFCGIHIGCRATVADAGQLPLDLGPHAGIEMGPSRLIAAKYLTAEELEELPEIEVDL
jgi:hypothetical protein